MTRPHTVNRCCCLCQVMAHSCQDIKHILKFGVNTRWDSNPFSTEPLTLSSLMNENRWEVPAQEFSIPFEICESHSKMTQEEGWISYSLASFTHNLFLGVTSSSRKKVQASMLPFLVLGYSFRVSRLEKSSLLSKVEIA